MNLINKLIRTILLTGLVLIFATSCDEEETVTGLDETCETSASPTAVFGSENPYKPMNIYIYEAKLAGLDAPSGSVVAVYDGSTCVGTISLVSEIGSNPVVINAGADDGSSNGFTDGNDMSFKVWYNDCEFDATATFLDSDLNVTDAVSFSQQGTAFVNLSVTQ